MMTSLGPEMVKIVFSDPNLVRKHLNGLLRGNFIIVWVSLRGQAKFENFKMIKIIFFILLLYQDLQAALAIGGLWLPSFDLGSIVLDQL